MKWILALCVVAGPVLAQETCPAAPDHSAAKDEIYSLLARAEDEGTAMVLGGYLWQYWLDAPNAQSQDLLDQGMERRMAGDYLGARAVLARLIDYCPDYAEGYNQRAFASFLARDFEAASVDLEAAIAIDPRHLGALTGYAMTLIALDRNDEAQGVLRQALRLNPWLSERRLLTEPPEVEL